MATEGFDRVIAVLVSLLTEQTQKTEPTDTQRVSLVSTASPGTATLSNVASSAASVTLLAAAPRTMATVWNDSTAILYLKFGATAIATSATVPIAAQGYYEFPSPIDQGRVDGIWASANGFARITEWV